jgi:hypothetical protein
MMYLSDKIWPLVVILVSTGLFACERGQRSDDVSRNVEGVAEAAAAEQAKPSEKPEVDDNQVDKQADSESKFYYSPFVVHLEADRFDTVSFKDVGLGRDEPTPQDAVLEAISQAFLYEVGNHTDLNYQGEVVYDERILDPANHLYCGDRHLYVDVWRAEGPKRWGYSLWSGCGEADNFAWEEVEIDVSEDAPLTDEVSPLARSIAERLAKADSENCFTKTC